MYSFSYLAPHTYDLELNGHDTEVDHLHRGPNDEVRLKSWHVNILELMGNGTPATTFADSHECEEAAKT